MKRLLAPFLCLLVIGCGTFEPPPVPETPRQALAAAEITFGGILRTVLTLQETGVIEPGSDTDRAVKNAVSGANTALIAWQATPDSLDAQTAALAALTAAQAALVRAQGG